MKLFLFSILSLVMMHPAVNFLCLSILKNVSKSSEIHRKSEYRMADKIFLQIENIFLFALSQKWPFICFGLKSGVVFRIEFSLKLKRRSRHEKQPNQLFLFLFLFLCYCFSVSIWQPFFLFLNCNQFHLVTSSRI